MSVLNALAYTPTNQKGNGVLFYKGVDDTTTHNQYVLLAANQAGTDGVLSGVTARWRAEFAYANVDASGNYSFQKDSSGNNIYLYVSGAQEASLYATYSANLGAPIDDLANNILASTAITALPVTGIAVDVCRGLTMTGNASSSSVIKATGVDVEGVALSENFTLNGTSLVTGAKAFGVGLPITLSLVTAHTGDTFSVGVSDILGLPHRSDNVGAITNAVFGSTIEATRPTITVDATNISGNTILLNTDLDGSTTVTVNGVRSDAPEEFDRL